MKRRGFFRALFGLAASVVAAPVAAEVIKELPKVGTLITTEINAPGDLMPVHLGWAGDQWHYVVHGNAATRTWAFHDKTGTLQIK